MPQLALKWLAQVLLSKLAKDLAIEVSLLTLRRWAASTETTWDDEVVDTIEKALK